MCDERIPIELINFLAERLYKQARRGGNLD
jgi:hypothetical protein